MAEGVVEDGYMTATDFYSRIPKRLRHGTQRTTVSAPQQLVTAGTPLTITGTVLDQSPAQPGTPCGF